MRMWGLASLKSRAGVLKTNTGVDIVFSLKSVGQAARRESQIGSVRQSGG